MILEPFDPDLKGDLLEMVPKIERHDDKHTGLGDKLPEMAAMFFDELAQETGGLHIPELPEISDVSDLRKKIKFIRLPQINKKVIEKSIRLRCDIHSDRIGTVSYRKEDPFTLLRSFILNLSHTYNNILMGVMGHVTLMKIDLKEESEHHDAIVQIEQLIQSGANLINLILGYLVERRLSTKRLQLIQLFGDFELCRQSENMAIDIESFKENMKRIAAIRDQSKIVAAVARILDQLLVWIKNEIESLAELNLTGAKVKLRLSVVDDLFDRGFSIVKDLMYHAGVIKPAICRTSLRTLMGRHIARLKDKYARITIWNDIPGRLPWLYIDRNQIDYAVKQVIDNAIEAMPGKGTLSIRVRTIAEETPSERCVVNMGSDYLVVSISDSGHGMDISTQGKIFIPFYKEKPGPKVHIGLGLSAASGIVKAHGGYIQVRSARGSGTRVKLYLPLN